MLSSSPRPSGRGNGEGGICLARNLRQNQTDVEKKLWLLLCGRRLCGFKFRRQHPIGKYVVDFCCLEKKVVIELDGGQHAWQGVYDAMRTNAVEKKGFRIVRFWNNQVIENPQGVFDRIVAVLKSPHLSPLPAGQRK